MTQRGHPDRWLGEEPRVRSVEIIAWLYRTHSDEDFTARDVARAFKITEADARGRLDYMRVGWGAVVKVGAIRAHHRGRRRHTYRLTRWGRKYGAKRARKAKDARRRPAANPEDE